MHTSQSTLHIAIVGGGIAGVALALDLCRHPHLSVQLFESAPAFGEVGAGVSFGANAVRAIAGLGIAEPYRQIADRTLDPWQVFGSNGAAARMPVTSAQAWLKG